MGRGCRPLLLPCLILVVVGCGLSVSVGRISISEIGTCQEVDTEGQPLRITSIFPAGTHIVYLYFRLESPTAVPLEIRWFWEDNLIGTMSQRLEAGLHHTWLAAEEGESLPPGKYRVEVIAGKMTIGETNFVIR
jgi:hypothetical protein